MQKMVKKFLLCFIFSWLLTNLTLCTLLGIKQFMPLMTSNSDVMFETADNTKAQDGTRSVVLLARGKKWRHSDPDLLLAGHSFLL